MTLEQAPANQVAGFGLDVIAFGDDSWRVSSPDLDPADPHCVLAYVERRGDVFSILELAPRPGKWATAASMEDAVKIVAASRVRSSAGGSSTGLRARR
jgi:hypothetical protein